MKKILYGIPSEGMGHAIRSSVVIDFLLSEGHEILVVTSKRAFEFLNSKYELEDKVKVQEIKGLHLKFEDNELKWIESIFSNVKGVATNLGSNVHAYHQVSKLDFKADFVISDFESWSFYYALRKNIPIISLDNMQIFNRCEHDRGALKEEDIRFRIPKILIKSKLPGAFHYLISSFYKLPIRKERTTIVPPVIRKSILNLKREVGDHILVYQSTSSNEELAKVLNQFDIKFKVYGLGEGETKDNVSFHPFSEDEFLENLRTAKGIITGGGFTLITEALNLKIPVLSIPIENHPEQMLNAHYLQELGYGQYSKDYTKENIEAFLTNLTCFDLELKKYTPSDNQILFTTLKSLIQDN